MHEVFYFEWNHGFYETTKEKPGWKKYAPLKFLLLILFGSFLLVFLISFYYFIHLSFMFLLFGLLKIYRLFHVPPYPIKSVFRVQKISFMFYWKIWFLICDFETMIIRQYGSWGISKDFLFFLLYNDDQSTGVLYKHRIKIFVLSKHASYNCYISSMAGFQSKDFDLFCVNILKHLSHHKNSMQQWEECNSKGSADTLTMCYILRAWNRNTMEKVLLLFCCI